MFDNSIVTRVFPCTACSHAFAHIVIMTNAIFLHPMHAWSVSVIIITVAFG